MICGARRLPTTPSNCLLRPCAGIRFVQHDGPVSIRRSFTPRDWHHYIHEAGLDAERRRYLRRMAGTSLRCAGEMMAALAHSDPAEALIIGGGPAGAALGIMLARAGRAVEIIEQSASMHHKVCGEFLSWEAVTYIAQLGD